LGDYPAVSDASIDHQLIGLISEQIGVPRGKITPSSRLLQDLGMDGDDAVEFFADFAERYGADLTPLYTHWDKHFGPEGLVGPTSFAVMLVLVALPFLALPFGVSPLWVMGAEFVALVLWMWPLRQWLIKDETVPVTVEHLLITARTKRWPITYERE
jgi:acyl carrier protein